MLAGERAKLRRVVPVNGLVKRAVPVVVLPRTPLNRDYVYFSPLRPRLRRIIDGWIKRLISYAKTGKRDSWIACWLIGLSIGLLMAVSAY